MADDWRHSTWGEEISLEYGKALRGYSKEHGTYRVFGSNGPIGWTSEPLVQGPGVILGRKGAYRGVEYSSEPFWVIDTAYYVVPKTELNLRWIYYAIKHYKLGEIDDGSPIPSTTRAAVYVKEVHIPPRRDQEAIACILGALDDKIELNRRMSQTLEQMARALFKSWFIDFDPVRRNAARARNQPSPGASRHPLPEGEGGGSIEELDRLFPDRFVDSELGEIPKGWEVRVVGDLLELAYGKALKAEDRRNGDIPVYGSNGQVGWHDEYLVAGPGIVVGRKGNPGTVTWVPTDFFPIDTTFYVVPKAGCQQLSFLFHALWTHDLASLSADSAVPGLNRNLVYMSRQVLPPAPLRDQFQHIASALSQREYQTNAESRTLAQLRDALLPKLISGELRVKDAEKFLTRRGL